MDRTSREKHQVERSMKHSEKRRRMRNVFRKIPQQQSKLKMESGATMPAVKEGNRRGGGNQLIKTDVGKCFP